VDSSDLISLFQKHFGNITYRNGVARAMTAPLNREQEYLMVEFMAECLYQGTVLRVIVSGGIALSELVSGELLAEHFALVLRNHGLQTQAGNIIIRAIRLMSPVEIENFCALPDER
jgi:hypothetical protein